MFISAILGMAVYPAVMVRRRFPFVASPWLSTLTASCRLPPAGIFPDEPSVAWRRQRLVAHGILEVAEEQARPTVTVQLDGIASSQQRGGAREHAGTSTCALG
jgi:hypothetical protein